MYRRTSPTFGSLLVALLHGYAFSARAASPNFFAAGMPTRNQRMPHFLPRPSHGREWTRSAANERARARRQVHFNTSKEWERERFHVLNTQGLKVSPNVILRNMRDHSPAVLTLYGLSMSDTTFPLCKRVSWSQKMMRGELMTATMLIKTVARLHSHLVAGKSGQLAQIVPAVERAIDKFGLPNFRANILGFFNLIDECWGLRNVQYKEGAVYLRMTFLSMLALIFSDHKDFWQGDDRQLTVPLELRRKIASFPISDPEVIRLAGAGGMATALLYNLMVNHINSGKRTKRLTPRETASPMLQDVEEEAA